MGPQWSAGNTGVRSGHGLLRHLTGTIDGMTGPREPLPSSWSDDPTQPYEPGGPAGQVPPPGYGTPPPPGYGAPPTPPGYGQPLPPGYGTPPPPGYGAPPPPWYRPQGQGPPGGLPPIRAPELAGGPSPFTIIALVLVVALLIAAGGWYFLLRPSGETGSTASPSPTSITAAASPTPTSRPPRPTRSPVSGATPTSAPPTSRPRTPIPSPPKTPVPTPTPALSTEPSGSPAPSAPPGPSGSTGADASIDPAVVAQIDQVIGTVPGIRGLQPKKDVPYRFIAQDQFSAFFQQQFDKDNPPSQLAAEESFDKRVGLLPAGANLKDLILQLYSSQVAAFYDPATHQFTVSQRDSTFGPADKIVVAHEYDHALQDQYWHLQSTDIGDPSQGDAEAANIALVEGDATALMYEWARAELTPEELAQAVADSGSSGDQQLLDSMPLLLQQQLTFPYLGGLLFVSALQGSGSGGWAEVNKAWDYRPTTTEQIIHPDKYLAGEGAIPVTLPDLAAQLGSDWKASFTQTLGELETGIWLADGQGGGSAGLGLPVPLPNAEAAAGWGGDRLVSLDGPNGTWAIVWQTAWDTATDADEFDTTADSVMADLPGAHEVVKTSIAGALGAPVLVVMAGDQQTLDTVKLALPSG